MAVAFSTACQRLGSLVQQGWLGAASWDAYQHGLTTVIRVGPVGERPGAAKRVRVHRLDPVHHADAMTVAMRWEATGITQPAAR